MYQTPGSDSMAVLLESPAEYACWSELDSVLLRLAVEMGESEAQTPSSSIIKNTVGCSSASPGSVVAVVGEDGT